MKTTLKLEEAMMFALSLFLFHQGIFPWTWFAILFLAPDLGLLGYLVSPKTGAITYNIASSQRAGCTYLSLWNLLFSSGAAVYRHFAVCTFIIRPDTRIWIKVL
jgi:hypothetical protein